MHANKLVHTYKKVEICQTKINNVFCITCFYSQAQNWAYKHPNITEPHKHCNAYKIDRRLMHYIKQINMYYMLQLNT